MLFGRYSTDAEFVSVSEKFLLQQNFQKLEEILYQASLSELKEKSEEIQKWTYSFVVLEDSMRCSYGL